MKYLLSFFILSTGLHLSLFSQTPAFVKTVITRDFISEGVAAADLNKDGEQDIIAGYYWFEAPTWKRHELLPGRIFEPRKEYSESFLNLALDVNLDGWEDVVIIDYPGKAGFWLENPQNKSGHWLKHVIADEMGISNESPGFIDIDGDGRLDILCGDYKKRQIVWLQAPTEKGVLTWTRHPISAAGVKGTDRFSHGIGFGDVNMDGIKDVVITDGWFEGKKDLSSGDWIFHEATLGEPCSHMQILDVNGDGKNDVVSASAHALGVWWHEQINVKGSIAFKTHLISNATSQTHSTIMADIDGDGKEEMITGKRFLAHNGNDAGDGDTPILMYFNFDSSTIPYFGEHIIDYDSGAGLNIAVRDMNKDNKPDLIIANKNGVFVLINQMTPKK
ncbi:MAG: FG-GAP repeat domain-containing protein [Saprospiraceae bacterium]